MTQIRITSLPKMYGDPEGFNRAVREGALAGLAQAGAEGRGVVVSSIMAGNPVPLDTGAMRSGQMWEIQNDIYTVRIGPSPAVLTRTVAMEKGRKPGGKMPPPAALARWAERKRMVRAGEDSASVGFRLARSIRRKGIKARRFYARSLAAIRIRASRAIRGRILESLRRHGFLR